MSSDDAGRRRWGAVGLPGETEPVVTVKLLASPFVASDAGALTDAIVLRPSTAVDRLPPIKGEPSPIAARAIEQHAVLVRTLEDRGCTVHQIEPQTRSASESLVADCALLLPEGAIIARPSQIDRRAEVAAVEARLTELGIPILARIEPPGVLDATDVALAPGRIFIGVPAAGAGLRPRSNELGRRQLEAVASQHGYRTVELTVASDVPRLRDVFSIVGAETAIAAPDRVDLVPVSGVAVVELPRGEEFAAGVLPIAERRVLANLRFRESLVLMRKAKIAVEAIDLWEFGKAGFGPFSLVLALKRT